MLRYRLKKPYRDGTTHVFFEPLDLLAWLAAVQARLLAVRHAMDMPISQQVYRVLHDGVSVRQAFYELFSRPPGAGSR